MELRVLEYFLTVAREQSITRAAELLHITQPTMSRQLMQLESEFGKKLFIRGNRKITLTEEGKYLLKRAEEIISLSRRTEDEMKNQINTLSGDIYIGTGESASVRHIIKVAHKIQKEYPDVRFHFTSGDSIDLIDRLDKGLFDFCILYGETDRSKYDCLLLPYKERWGVLMHNQSELAVLDRIKPEYLRDKPLIVSRQMLDSPGYFDWLGAKRENLNIINSYNLAFTGTLMASEQMGYVLTLADLINIEGTELCFKEIDPMLELNISLVWKKHKVNSKIAEKFITEISRLK